MDHGSQPCFSATFLTAEGTMVLKSEKRNQDQSLGPAGEVTGHRTASVALHLQVHKRGRLGAPSSLVLCTDEVRSEVCGCLLSVPGAPALTSQGHGISSQMKPRRAQTLCNTQGTFQVPLATTPTPTLKDCLGVQSAEMGASAPRPASPANVKRGPFYYCFPCARGWALARERPHGALEGGMRA